MRKLLLLVFLSLGLSTLAATAEEALWLRYPQISPDGTTIIFSYKGDLFKVPVTGGSATQLTTNPAYDYNGFWLPDGKNIAFNSDRNGNMDLYLMSAIGGEPIQLTTHSGNDLLQGVSRDGSKLFYLSSVQPDATFSQTPLAVMSSTYTVEVTGGRPRLYSPIEMGDIAFNKDGSALLYTDRKGYEDPWRKHHTSSVTRDVWKYEAASKAFTKISDFVGENRNAVYSPEDNNIIYFLSEKDGSFNVWKRNLTTKEETQITFHKDHPVRFLSVSENGTLCYAYNGELYTYNGEEKHLTVDVVTDRVEREEKRFDLSSGIRSFSVSPDGKEIAIITRGDVYVTSVEYATTVRITDTPEQERFIDFSPDGKSIAYASERDGSWNVYMATIGEEDMNFCYGKNITESAVTTGNITCFDPQFSPDGKEIAFLQDRTNLMVKNLKSGKVRKVLDAKYNYSYSDGDQSYMWSPDGKWFAVKFMPNGMWNREDAALVQADGSGKIINLTESGYLYQGVNWVLDGKALMMVTDRYGLRSHGGWGSAEMDLTLMFLNQKAYDEFTSSKEDLALAKAMDELNKSKREKKKEEKEKKAEEKKAEEGKIVLPEVEYDLDNVEDFEDRMVRLTYPSGTYSDAFITKDGNKMLYIARYENSFDLWVRDLKEGSTKLLSKGIGSGSFLTDAKNEKLFLASRGNLYTVDINSGSTKPIPVSAEFIYRPAGEREYILDHAWKQVADKFYDPSIRGLDWNMYHENYAKFLPHINNNYDFKDILGEMLGELNASHTGGRYRPSHNDQNTATFGMFFDQMYEGDGLKIVEVMPKNPIIKAGSKMKAGVIIEAIDGHKIKAGEDYYPFLNHKADKYVELTLSEKGKTWTERVKLITNGEESVLRYERWKRVCAELVDSLSNGRLGYVHVEGMDSPSFRETYSKVLGKYLDRDAMVVDTRCNGGGWLHDDLVQLFSGKRYCEFTPRGQFIAKEPFNRWDKPSAVLICEGNYSDAHGFPFAYSSLGIGKLIGMPVPGTMTAVWWETQIDPSIVFGIPMVGTIDVKTGEYLENVQLEPDIKVVNTPESLIQGRDLQLEATVKELLKELE